MTETLDFEAPVVAIDGPSGSGKGTVGRRVAQRLGWHFLDSGALYRALALAALKRGLALNDGEAVARLAAEVVIEFQPEGSVLVDQEDVSKALRAETCGNAASKIATQPRVRTALLELQRSFRRPPGLVADGRDMGTVVFPNAAVKVFLTASAEERARRRYNQLMDKGIHANLDNLINEITERDRRDTAREVAPLEPAVDAFELDSTSLSIEVVVEQVLMRVAARG